MNKMFLLDSFVFGHFWFVCFLFFICFYLFPPLVGSQKSNEIYSCWKGKKGRANPSGQDRSWYSPAWYKGRQFQGSGTISSNIYE